MTSHVLGGLAGSRQTLLSDEKRHGRHLESMTSYQKSHSGKQCAFTGGTIPPNLIQTQFEIT